MEAPEQGELRGDGRAGGARGSWSVAAEPPLWEVSQSFRRLGAWPILLPAPPEVEPSVVSPAMSRLRRGRQGGPRAPSLAVEAGFARHGRSGRPLPPLSSPEAAPPRRATSGWGDAH